MTASLQAQDERQLPDKGSGSGSSGHSDHPNDKKTHKTVTSHDDESSDFGIEGVGSRGSRSDNVQTRSRNTCYTKGFPSCCIKDESASCLGR